LDKGKFFKNPSIIMLPELLAMPENIEDEFLQWNVPGKSARSRGCRRPLWIFFPSNNDEV